MHQSLKILLRLLICEGSQGTPRHGPQRPFRRQGGDARGGNSEGGRGVEGKVGEEVGVSGSGCWQLGWSVCGGG